MKSNLIQRVLFLSVVMTISFFGGGLLGRTSPQLHSAATAAAPSATRAAEGGVIPVCTGDACQLHQGADTPDQSTEYEEIEFYPEEGGKFSLPYSHLVARSLNRNATVYVIQFSLYQAIIEGERLEDIDRQVAKRRIGRMQASVLANGDTYALPVIPLGVLEHRKPGEVTTPVPTLISFTADDDAGGDGLPVIRRVRVELDVPFHYDGRTGAYVSDEDK